MSPQKAEGHRLEREARLRWVPVKNMHVSPLAQRDFKQSRVDHLLVNFDPEKLGYPTLNQRADGSWWIIDGQHRIRSYQAWMGEGNWEDQSLQCQTYMGMTEPEEAEMFLQLNDTLSVTSFDKFMVGVTAGRLMECDIDRIVRAHNMRVARNRIQDENIGTISAVTTLVRVYQRSGPEALGRTLRIIFGAYGQEGLESSILDGIGLLVGRYGQVNDKDIANKLSNRLGITALLTSAKRAQDSHGGTKANSIAAAAVEMINKKTTKRAEKLSDWWKSTNEREVA